MPHFFGPNGRALFDDNSGTSQMDRIAGQLQYSNDSGATFTPIGSGGSASPAAALGAWGVAALAQIQLLVPGLTDVIIAEECGNYAPNWDATPNGLGTLTLNGTSWSFQTGVTSGGSIYLLNKSTVKFNPNIRTTPSAIAVRVTKIANTATTQQQMCCWTDAIASPVIVGIQGATSQTNYTIKVGAAAIVDTGQAQSAPGTYDSLILACDGTNYFTSIALAAGAYSAALGTTAASNAGNAANPCLMQPLVSSSTNANSGFKVDKILVVMGPAT